MNMKFTLIMIALLSTFSFRVNAEFASTAKGCAAGPALISPSIISSNPVSGSSGIGSAVQILINCSSGVSYNISTPSAVFSSSVGGAMTEIQGVWFKDAAFTQPLSAGAITGTTASSGPVSITLYSFLSGPKGGAFQGLGAYAFTMNAVVISSGGPPITANLTESGALKGTCTINNAAVNFGNVVAGTNPIQPVTIVLNCTSGLAWSLSQPSTAPVTIGASSLNTGWIYATPGSSPLSSVSIIGSGTGATQTKTMYVGLSGATIGTPISGTGTISGSIPVTVTY